MPLALLLAVAAGCSQSAGEERLRRVLSADPGFADALDRHRLLVARGEALERELDLKRLIVRQTISQLNHDVDATELEIRRKQAKLREALAPLRERLENDLAQTLQEQRQRELERSQLSRLLTRLRKDRQPGAPENPEWAEARQAVVRLEAEARGLKAHADLARLKLDLIRFE